eukprot:NODE_25794_length_575_cov_2.116071.p3 GENE.NODE_25794_length_575_cov_2.116071~~NODE_25794_length_575_cov_2.116071.p3  ORF type:complete len:90 (+),score=18.08 NODE_25794_length_575_cov_2.116071:100-369(+)
MVSASPSPSTGSGEAIGSTTTRRTHKPQRIIATEIMSGLRPAAARAELMNADGCVSIKEPSRRSGRLDLQCDRRHAACVVSGELDSAPQ